MKKSKKYVLSVEVYKYPYCGRPDKNEDYLSNKICCYTIRTRKKIVRKTKRVFVYVQLIISLGNGLAPIAPTPAIGLPILLNTPPIMRSIHSDVGLSKKAIIAQVIKKMPAEIDFTETEINELYQFSVECKINSLSQEELITKITNLRGGDFVDVVAGLAIIAAIIILANNANGFQPIIPPHLQWLYGNQQPGNHFGYGKKAGDCGTQLHAGSSTQSLKTWKDRNQPNPKDRWFLLESRPELVMRRGQSKFKTKSHGALAGLPYSVKNNGSTSTLKTEKNVDIFMDVVEEIVYDTNTLWFEEATYQGGTDREVESINLYSEKHNRIIVFLRSTGEFITFCEPTLNEVEDLSQTANFGGQDNWFSSTPKNMPPQQDFKSDFTPVNSFESDVMGITPISSIDENSSPNQFESNVLGIIPVDPDWQI